MNRKKLKERELEKGIKVKTKHRQGTLREKDFINLIKTKPIKTQTFKGLKYLEEIK